MLILANGIQENTESILRKEFGNDAKITFVKFQIPSEIKSNIKNNSKQKFFSESVFIWNVKRLDSLIAIGLMDNVYGKAQPITFLTIFNLYGEVISNHIVKYREEHGGAVTNSDWNKQFVGMNRDSDFTEIDGISGATISVNAIKKGVQKLTLLFNHIQLEDL